MPPGRSPPERFVFIGATADGRRAARVSAGKPEERADPLLWLPAEEIVTAEVRIARPTVKPGETLDLGDLRVAVPHGK